MVAFSDIGEVEVDQALVGWMEWMVAALERMGGLMDFRPRESEGVGLLEGGEGIGGGLGLFEFEERGVPIPSHIESEAFIIEAMEEEFEKIFADGVAGIGEEGALFPAEIGVQVLGWVDGGAIAEGLHGDGVHTGPVAVFDEALGGEVEGVPIGDRALGFRIEGWWNAELLKPIDGMDGDGEVAWILLTKLTFFFGELSQVFGAGPEFGAKEGGDIGGIRVVEEELGGLGFGPIDELVFDGLGGGFRDMESGFEGGRFPVTFCVAFDDEGDALHGSVAGGVEDDAMGFPEFGDFEGDHSPSFGGEDEGALTIDDAGFERCGVGGLSVVGGEEAEERSIVVW